MTPAQPRGTIAAAEHIAVEDEATHQVSDTVAYLLASAVYFADFIFVGAAFWLITQPRPLKEFWERAAEWLGMQPWLEDREIPLWKAILRLLTYLLGFALTLLPMALIIASILLTLDLLGR